MFFYGARQIILEGDITKCLEMRAGAVLVGERDGLPIPGFDLTNSPFLIMKKGRPFFNQKKVVHRTTSGVTGALSALERSDEVLLASFLTARATADYIKARAPDTVSIVAMGTRSVSKAPEDECCADYIESLLTGTPYDHLKAVQQILCHESARKFLRGDKLYYPREDPAICLQRDIFNFALRAERKHDLVFSVKINAAGAGARPGL
jgi:2-phosphosulfolactate phosphatase